MSDLYLKALQATGAHDSGLVAKAGKWAADEIERLKAELKQANDEIEWLKSACQMWSSRVESLLGESDGT